MIVHTARGPGVTVHVITGADPEHRHGPLDPINVLLQDFGSNRGRLTIACFGSAWTTYWGAMGGADEPRDLAQFIASVGPGYVASKLAPKRRDEHWLDRIVAATVAVVRLDLKATRETC